MATTRRGRRRRKARRTSPARDDALRQARMHGSAERPPAKPPRTSLCGAARASQVPASATRVRVAANAARVRADASAMPGTTLCGRTWKAQLHAHGKLHFSCGHETEEAAALAWNELARRFGRTDLNVVPAEQP
jgi:hypothetical protein